MTAESTNEGAVLPGGELGGYRSGCCVMTVSYGVRFDVVVELFCTVRVS